MGASNIYRITLLGVIVALVGFSLAFLLVAPADASVEQSRIGIVTAVIAPTIIGLLALLRTETVNNKTDLVREQAEFNAQKTDTLAQHVADGMAKVAVLASERALDPLDNPNHYQRIATLIRQAVKTGDVPSEPPSLPPPDAEKEPA